MSCGSLGARKCSCRDSPRCHSGEWAGFVDQIASNTDEGGWPVDFQSTREQEEGSWVVGILMIIFLTVIFKIII